jgi:hypothetical protein
MQTQVRELLVARQLQLNGGTKLSTVETGRSSKASLRFPSPQVKASHAPDSLWVEARLFVAPARVTTLGQSSTSSDQFERTKWLATISQ